MKKLIGTLFALLLVVSLSANAATTSNEIRMNTYLQNLENAIKSDNDGVQYWGLFLLARAQSENPTKDFSPFNRTLNRIMNKEKSDLLRVNAKMTYLYINNSELVQNVKVKDKENPNEFYTNLYQTKYNQKFGIEDTGIADVNAEANDNLASTK